MFKNLMFSAAAVTLIGFAGAANADTTSNPLPTYADGAPITISGTINEVRSDEFDLSYGNGAVTVELDGWGWTGEETKYLTTGDTVTVSGRIDDDLFEGREIEADNLYLKKSTVYYYENDTYPSYYMAYDSEDTMRDGAYISMRGTVSDIDEDEFTLTSDNGFSIEVDAEDLEYDLFDDEGLQLKDGDKVHVYGTLDDGMFDSREIDADSVVFLTQVGTPSN